MAACYEFLTPNECNSWLHPLSGLVVSNVWGGYAGALFVELGTLRQGARNLRGQVTIALYLVWRIEKGGAIVCSVDSPDEELLEGGKQLKGKVLHASTVADNGTDLTIFFDDGSRIWAGAPEGETTAWAVYFNDRTHVQLDPIWRLADVNPVLGVHEKRLGIEYCFEEDNVDMAKLKEKYVCPW